MVEERSPAQVRRHFVKSMPNDVGSLFHVIWQEVAALHLNWSTFLELFGKDAATVELLNYCASGFFVRLQTLLWNDVFIRLSRLTDPARTRGRKPKENASLALLNERIAPHIGKRSSRSLATGLARIEKSMAPIRRCRNTQLAHLSVALLVGPKGKLGGITRMRVERSVGLVGDFVNRVESKFAGNRTSFHLANAMEYGGAEDIVFWLSYAKAEKDKEESAIMQGLRHGG